MIEALIAHANTPGHRTIVLENCCLDLINAQVIAAIEKDRERLVEALTDFLVSEKSSPEGVEPIIRHTPIVIEEEK